VRTKKRRPEPPYYYVVECPICDYATWMWKSLGNAYAEFSEHLMDEHGGNIEFVGEAE
jgi:hypothetical protein